MPIDIKLSSCKKGPWKFRGRAASLKWFQLSIHGSRCPPLSCLSLISLDLAAAGPGWAEDWPKPARMQRTSRSSSMLVVVTHVCGWPHRSSCLVLPPKSCRDGPLPFLLAPSKAQSNAAPMADSVAFGYTGHRSDFRLYFSLKCNKYIL